MCKKDREKSEVQKKLYIIPSVPAQNGLIVCKHVHRHIPGHFGLVII